MKWCIFLKSLQTNLYSIMQLYFSLAENSLLQKMIVICIWIITLNVLSAPKIPFVYLKLQFQMQLLCHFCSEKPNSVLLF